MSDLFLLAFLFLGDPDELLFLMDGDTDLDLYLDLDLDMDREKDEDLDRDRLLDLVRLLDLE